MELARAAWEKPDSQWTWCRHWVERALELAAGEEAEVRLGAGTRDETIERLERDYAGRLRVVRDDELSPGLVVYFGERALDARLLAHCPRVEQFIASVLNGWMATDREVGDV